MDELLTRGVSHIYPSPEALEKELKSGRKLRIYFGIDPTGPDLHLGHVVPLLKLREWQDLGHQAILLIGDFTAMIGDPTDKSAARVMLSPAQVKENSKNYLAQVWKILDEKKTEVCYNGEWLAKLSLADTIKLASEFTVSQILERDMFQKRLATGSAIHLHEFLYPILQGYDSVALDVDLEIGGNDQIFNMLVGRDLLKSLKHKEKFVLATKLLAAPGETKMSKTEGNLVTLADSPSEMYGQVMSWPDPLLPLGFEILTRLPDEEIKKILTGHPRDAKMRLAREIVVLIHGAAEAKAAEQKFVSVFQDKTEATSARPAGSVAALELVAEIKNVSKAEARRLIEQNALKIVRAGETKVCTDPKEILELKAADLVYVGRASRKVEG